MKPAFAAFPLALLAACDAGTEPDVSVEAKVAAHVATPSLPTVAEMAAPPAPGGIGCSPEEAPIFACNLANGKRIAICSSGEFSGQYRYGDSTPELVIDGGEFAHVMYSGGGEGQIAFINEGFRYVVFSRVVRTNFASGEPNYPATTDGVIVLRGEDVVGMQVCAEPAVMPIALNTAGAVWDIQEDLFTSETYRAGP